MTPQREEAARLLRLARQDQAAFSALLGAPGVAVAVAFFHAQQAAEKALKAVMCLRGLATGQRKAVGGFFSHGRESHGLWTNPENTLLYVAHELDELPSTPNAGQTVCSAFDASNPLRPNFITPIPLGNVVLRSGQLERRRHSHGHQHQQRKATP